MASYHSSTGQVIDTSQDNDPNSLASTAENDDTGEMTPTDDGTEEGAAKNTGNGAVAFGDEERFFQA